MKDAILKFKATPLTVQEAVAAELPDTRSTWLKFVFTDDKPNGNNQGVRQDEFINLAQTGVFKPFKKATLGPNDHYNAVPIGSIASLEIDDSQIIGIASVWDAEYPEEAKWIKSKFANKEPLDVSWEIIHTDSEIDADGTEWLVGCATRGVSLVDNPAYGGRTPIIAVASQWSPKYNEGLKDESFLVITEAGRYFPYIDVDGNVDLQQLQGVLENSPPDVPAEVLKEARANAHNILNRIKMGDKEMDDFQKQLDAANSRITELETDLGKFQSVASLEELLALKTEVESLREYKETSEAEKARAEKINARFAEFSQAGIEMDKEKFMEEADNWLAMSDDAFGFVLRTLFTENRSSESQSNSSKNPGVPPVNVDADEPDSDLELVKEYLNKRREDQDGSK